MKIKYSIRDKNRYKRGKLIKTRNKNNFNTNNTTELNYIYF